MLSVSSYLDYLESGPQQQSEPHLPNPALTSFRTRQQNPSGTTAAPQGRGWPRHATLENSSKHRVDICEIFHTARVPFIFHSSSTERFSAKRNDQPTKGLSSGIHCSFTRHLIEPCSTSTGKSSCPRTERAAQAFLAFPCTFPMDKENVRAQRWKGADSQSSQSSKPHQICKNCKSWILTGL